MLKKISLRRIKSPLSLRGLFPFCHSREGGNPSPYVIARERSDRSNLNLSGFSLIELMVAVVILALAIFGIFQAYSTGFMGMADARDRTVATNYAREAMEDIKNKDFDQIIPQSRTLISGTKYEREVIVDGSVANLKKVTSKVYWKDRNGTNWRMVETSMTIHFIETTAGTSTRIMLIANPYNVLTKDDSTTADVYENRSIITAVVKDEKGNTVTTYNDNITFTLYDVNPGKLIDISGSEYSSTYSVNAVKGVATVTFQASEIEGDVTIEASDSVLIPDSINIKVTDPDIPVKIHIINHIDAEEKLFMTPGSVSTITATIVNAGGFPVAISKEITFSVSGPGNLSSPTTLSTVDEYGNPTGIATITLTSNGTPGTITVTASSTGLEPGVVEVITGGKISLSAPSTTVPLNERLEITVTTKDVNSVPINYVGDISLSIGEGSTGLGNLPSEPVHFDGSSSSMTVDFTAGGTSDTIVNINADDLAGILTSAVPLPLHIIEELVPDYIEVYAIQSSIPAGGSETSTITAKVMTSDNTIVTSYTNTIVFTTTKGHFLGGDTTISTGDPGVTYTGGVVTVELYPSDYAETAEITVSSTVSEGKIITGSTKVGFYIGPDHILLNAVPQKLSADGQSCILTAKIVDYNGNVVSDYNKDITFIISPWPPGPIKFAKATTYILTQKVKKGIATVILVSGSEAGTAVIDAFSGDVSGSLNIPVGIALNLVNSETSPFYDSVANTVSFDIEILGAPLKLEEMKVSWAIIGDPPETLDKIEIKTPSETGIVSTVFDDSTNPALSGELISFEEVTLSESEGTSNVKIYFNADMSEKTITVIFNPNSGNYPVEFTLP